MIFLFGWSKLAIHASVFHRHLVTVRLNLLVAPGMQVEGLIHELLLCVGLFTVLETRNQDVLLWGKVPTPVHKLCTLFNSLAEQPSVASSLRCTLLAVGIPNQPVCEVMHLHSMHLGFACGFQHAHQSAGHDQLLARCIHLQSVNLLLDCPAQSFTSCNQGRLCI